MYIEERQRVETHISRHNLGNCANIQLGTALGKSNDRNYGKEGGRWLHWIMRRQARHSSNAVWLPSRRMPQEEVRPSVSCPHSALLTGALRDVGGHWPLYHFSAGKCAPQGANRHLWHFDIKLVSQTDPHSSAKTISEGSHFENLHPRQDILGGDRRWEVRNGWMLERADRKRASRLV
jgi:hypothetical protein